MNTNKLKETKKQRYILIKNKEGDTTPATMEISIMHYRENE